MACQWSEGSVIRLIELIRDNAHIWDPGHELYKNKVKRLEAFHRIADAMELPREEIERKWKVIQTQFRREYLRSKNRSNDLSEEACNSPWFGYKHLLFLVGKYSSKEVQNKSFAIKEEPDKRKSVLKKSMLKHCKSSDSQFEDTSNVMKSFTEKQEIRDGCMVYGEYVGNKLRNYDLYTRADVEHKINCILHEADMKVLQQQ